MKNIIYIYILLSFLYPGTLYFSKTLDSVETNTDTYIINYQIKNTYSFGYEHAIWQKRKIKYDVFAGGELLTNSDVRFLNVYVLAWYKINKLVTLLYPQWTKGTTVAAGANTFTFLISSSPPDRNTI